MLTKRFALWRNLDWIELQFPALSLHFHCCLSFVIQRDIVHVALCIVFIKEATIESPLIALSKNFPRTLPGGKIESLLAVEMLSGSGGNFVVAAVVVVG